MFIRLHPYKLSPYGLVLFSLINFPLYGLVFFSLVNFPLYGFFFFSLINFYSLSQAVGTVDAGIRSPLLNNLSYKWFLLLNP